jgi:hypothetical protein
MTLLPVLWAVIAGFNATIGLLYYGHVHSTRWNVKTLADRPTLPKKSIATTIAEQHTLHSPSIDEGTSRQPSECTIYTIKARIVESLLESDGDYHLVLEDNGLQMVAEIPQPIDPVPSEYRPIFYAARRTIDSLIGAPDVQASVLDQPKCVEVTGVGFFDESHTFVPHGMAPNCREIHPVLFVKGCNR